MTSPRTHKPTIPQYDYLESLAGDSYATAPIGTRLACLERGWITQLVNLDDGYKSMHLTEAGREILDAGRPELSDKVKRTKTQRAAENAVAKMLNAPGVDLVMLAEILGTSIRRLVDLNEAARTYRR